MKISLPKFLPALLLVPFVTFAGDPEKTGDVLGRDLNVRKLGDIGHVGIWTGSRVLEVLKDSKPVISDDSRLGQFKGKSPYWGARHYYDFIDYRPVVRAGRKQKEFSPRYTTTASYTVGETKTKRVWNKRKKRYEEKTVTENAVFRCDTFVYYCYSAGVGMDLSSRGAVLPAIVYDNLPFSR